MKRAVIFANGILTDPPAVRDLMQDDDLIIAADGGLRNALAAGLKPRVVIGDLDSASPADLDEMKKTGVEVMRFPAEKNETDLELAIRHAINHHIQEIVVVAAVGGRLDQTLGNIALLADVPDGVEIHLDDGSEEVRLAEKEVQIFGKPGEIVSLIPWGEKVTSVRTEGLKYPLLDETLFSSKTRGISNELVENQASIQMSQGRLIIIHTRKKS